MTRYLGQSSTDFCDTISEAGIVQQELLISPWNQIPETTSIFHNADVCNFVQREAKSFAILNDHRNTSSR